MPGRHPLAPLFLHDALPISLDVAKQELDAEFAPAAYNIGINDGPAAGQTVPHLHVHLIPRYEGDLEDRKSTRLNSSHVKISYAVFCLKKKNNKRARAKSSAV